MDRLETLRTLVCPNGHQYLHSSMDRLETAGGLPVSIPTLNFTFQYG